MAWVKSLEMMELLSPLMSIGSTFQRIAQQKIIFVQWHAGPVSTFGVVEEHLLQMFRTDFRGPSTKHEHRQAMLLVFSSAIYLPSSQVR